MMSGEGSDEATLSMSDLLSASFTSLCVSCPLLLPSFPFSPTGAIAALLLFDRCAGVPAPVPQGRKTWGWAETANHGPVQWEKICWLSACLPVWFGEKHTILWKEDSLEKKGEKIANCSVAASPVLVAMCLCARASAISGSCHPPGRTSLQKSW